MLNVGIVGQMIMIPARTLETVYKPAQAEQSIRTQIPFNNGLVVEVKVEVFGL